MRLLPGIVILILFTGCISKKKVNYLWERDSMGVSEEIRLLEFKSESAALYQRWIIRKRSKGAYYSNIIYRGGKHYIVIYPETIKYLHKRFSNRINHPNSIKR